MKYLVSHPDKEFTGDFLGLHFTKGSAPIEEKHQTDGLPNLLHALRVAGCDIATVSAKPKAAKPQEPEKEE